MSINETTVPLDGEGYVTVETPLALTKGVIGYDTYRHRITIDLGKVYLELTRDQWDALTEAVTTVLPQAVTA